jgi:hypothetical protein
MAIYLISGKLGSGKSLSAVGRIRDALRERRRVATNLDLFLEKMLRPGDGQPTVRNGSVVCPVSVMRLPDKPSVSDLEMIGQGNDSYDETRNGLIVLDELGTWLNARTFQDRGRREVIDWLLHSRKYGWDVVFIIQHQAMVDKQIRDGLVEFLGVCRRLDRLGVPVLTPLLRPFGYKLTLPKVHVCTVRYGLEKDALLAERWWYQAKDLYDAYDTRQIFRDDDSAAVYSVLPPWHLTGRYQPSLGVLDKLRLAWAAAMPRPAPPVPKPRVPLVDLLARLPPDERVRHFKRLEMLGAI